MFIWCWANGRAPVCQVPCAGPSPGPAFEVRDPCWTCIRLVAIPPLCHNIIDENIHPLAPGQNIAHHDKCAALGLVD